MREKHIYKEFKLFENFKDKDDWYKARAYVLDKLKDVAIGPSSKERLHVLVKGNTPLMLSVVRQVALSAHYANYDEETGKNRTKITLVSEKEGVGEKLKEYLGNLLSYCKHTINSTTYNEDSYIDIELEVVNAQSNYDDQNALVVEMTEEDVNKFLENKSIEDISKIDIRKAVWASWMYDLGTIMDNLPAEDIHCASRYALALEVFQRSYLKMPIEERKASEKALGNIFCADCFESRKKGIDQYIETQEVKEKVAWEINNEALSKSEHARWVVEKLIMGFRPLTHKEHIKDEELFGEAKKQYRKDLKNNSKDPAHIDLCSYADLRRIDPGNMKYDSFLMLAIPEILKKNENE